jgi:hypothetical protein
MSSRRILLALILASSVLAAACTKAAVKQLGELQGLYTGLAKKFGDNVHVNATERAGVILTVTFLNSPLNGKNQVERGQRAQETAEFIKTQYSGIQSVREIWVLFVRQQTRFVIFHSRHGIDGYVFDKDAKALVLEDYGPQPRAGYGPAPRRDKEITAGYTSSEDATDISTASTLQIDGEPGGYGMTVLPHFKVSGDARRSAAPAPAEVSLFFASYSRKPRFSGEVPVEFITNGTPILQAKAKFTGNDAQYFNLKVSYPVFRKLITAKEVAIKLGAREYPLTPEQLAILQKMDAYVLQ